jgi:hypothetical protein
MNTRPLATLLLILVGLAAAAPDAPEAGLHDPLDRLLGQFVRSGLVRYHAWAESTQARQELTAYVDMLEAQRPAELTPSGELAYWINLYNAATLELVLAHYPVKSIKDIGGILRSPWKREIVRVADRALTLNDIENEIIRPRFKDARIHFALNCASRGCRPLAAEAFRAELLDAQLDQVCRAALNDERWVALRGRQLILTKIFEWYRSDFVQDAGSIAAFVGRYHRGVADAAAKGRLDIEFSDYDWSLNAIE